MVVMRFPHCCWKSEIISLLLLSKDEKEVDVSKNKIVHPILSLISLAPPILLVRCREGCCSKTWLRLGGLQSEEMCFSHLRSLKCLDEGTDRLGTLAVDLLSNRWLAVHCNFTEPVLEGWAGSLESFLEEH